jgi:hypothetical protein
MGCHHHPHATKRKETKPQQELPQPMATALQPPALLNPDHKHAIKWLIVAVIEQALFDADHGNTQAREWLEGDGLTWIDAIADIHPDKVRRRLLHPRRYRMAGAHLAAHAAKVKNLTGSPRND